MTIKELIYLKESEDKVEYLIDKLVGKIIVKHGSGKGTSYTLKKEINNIDSIINYFKKCLIQFPKSI